MNKVRLMSVMIITAIVVDALLGDRCTGEGLLNWISYSKCFSFQPGTIDINVFSLTFGISFEANVAQLLLVFAGIFAYYKIAPKIITK